MVWPGIRRCHDGDLSSHWHDNRGGDKNRSRGHQHWRAGSKCGTGYCDLFNRQIGGRWRDKRGNIYGGAGGATYSIVAQTTTTPIEDDKPAEDTEAETPEQESKKEQQKQTEEKKTELPTAPVVTVETSIKGIVYNPEQNQWSIAAAGNTTYKFNWDTAEGVTDFSYIFDDTSDTIPDDTSEGSNNFVEFSQMEDGIYYFHVKALNEAGWSETTHYTMYIDTTPPKLCITKLPHTSFFHPN